MYKLNLEIISLYFKNKIDETIEKKIYETLEYIKAQTKLGEQNV